MRYSTVMAYDLQTADRVRWILADHPGISEKKMFGGLSFLMRGAMCVSVSGRGGLLVRVGPDAHERLAREPHVQTMVMRGRAMTGFLRVMPEGYRTQPSLRKWVRRALDYAAVRPVTAAAKRKTPRRTIPKRRPGKKK
jgi:TfoX/Sxy family transcriptional regulator of competence genes